MISVAGAVEYDLLYALILRVLGKLAPQNGRGFNIAAIRKAFFDILAQC